MMELPSTLSRLAGRRRWTGRVHGVGPARGYDVTTLLDGLLAFGYPLSASLFLFSLLLRILVSRLFSEDIPHPHGDVH